MSKCKCHALEAGECVCGAWDEEQVCVWKYDIDGDHDDFYKTACGNGQYFSVGNIEDNKYIFCPYCGKKIKESV